MSVAFCKTAYASGWITKETLAADVKLGWISQDDYNSIVGTN